MNSPDVAARAIGRSLSAVLIPVCVTILSVVWVNLSLSPICRMFQKAETEDSDSQSQDESFIYKLLSSIEDAAYFVIVILVMTSMIYILYKHRCTIVLYGFLIVISGFAFVSPLWIMLDLTFTYFQIPYTTVFMAALLWNIGSVAVLSVFYYCHPVVTQANLIAYSVVSAWMLTRLSEWTAWSILVCISLYDIFAVLYTHGPLRLLVNLTQHRNEPLPGFVYNCSNRVTPIRRETCVAHDMATNSASDVSQTSSVQGVANVQRKDTTSSSIRLGLGDFIFYSLLVAKASDVGFVPYVLCLVAVLTGLVAVIILQISMTSHIALPALPISIFLGAAVFFACYYSIDSMNRFLCMGGVTL